MKKENGGLVLNVRNLHIHLDEHTDIRNDYRYPDCSFDDEDRCGGQDSYGDRVDNAGDTDRENCKAHGCGPDIDADCEDEDGSIKSFDAADVIRDVSEETGLVPDLVHEIIKARSEIARRPLTGSGRAEAEEKVTERGKKP